MSKTIYTELTIDQLKILLDNKYTKTSTIDNIIIKFTASWCGPCRKIKVLCDELFQKTSKTTICFNLDIDNDINAKLYSTLKSKKMIRGVPTLFGFNCKKKRNMDHWYIPDKSVVGSTVNDIICLFNQI